MRKRKTKFSVLLQILLLIGMMMPKPVLAYHGDGEISVDNRFGAAVLDLTVTSGQSNFVPGGDLVIGDSVARDIYLTQEPSSLSLRHKVSYEFLGGNSALCDQLRLELWYNHYHGPVSGGYGNRDMRKKYDGDLSALSDLGVGDDDFLIPHADDQYDDNPADGTTQWYYYRVTVPDDLPDVFGGENCRFNLNFTAWQSELADATGGFIDEESLESNLTFGTWLRPTSEITSTFDTQTFSTFSIDYDSSDNTDYVELWYSFNMGDWQLFGTDVPASPGSFNFTTPEGDGVYEFITVAVSDEGRVEDKDSNDIDDNTELDDLAMSLTPYEVLVDTADPITGLILGDFDDADRWAGQNIADNGDFEGDDYGSWTGQGSGDHTVVGSGFAYEGDKAYRVGFMDSDLLPGETTDSVFQLIPIPEKLSSSLSFWWRVVSNDIVDYDWFTAEIRDENDTMLERILMTGSDEVGPDSWSGDSGWRETTRSLLAYAGRTIKVWFGVTNNDEEGFEERTWAYVDNLVITTTDNQLGTDADVSTDAHDVESGVWDTEQDPLDPDVGEGTVDYDSEDMVGNEEDTKSADINVLPAIVLNKFMADPVGSDTGTAGNPLDGEWVELYNNTDLDIDVGGWYLYDAVDTHSLEITTSNVDTDEDLSDSDDLTVVPARGWLRVYRDGDADFSLNQDAAGDHLRLFNDDISVGVLVDEIEYMGLVGEGELWQRSPDGIGSWELIKSDWDYSLKYTNSGEKIWLVVYSLPTDVESVDYEITYESGAIEKGIAGTVNPDSIVDDKIDRQFVIGSCSANGACTYDSVDGDQFHLEITVNVGGSPDTKVKDLTL